MGCGCELYERYEAQYGALPREPFDRFRREAQWVLEDVTTGVDGVCKLRQCPPADEHWQGVIQDALLELVYAMQQIDAIAAAAGGLQRNADGTVQSGVVKSRSSGSESITYAAPGEGSAYAAAARDRSARGALLRDLARDRLRYVPDRFGVNLTYMGPYPYPGAIGREGAETCTGTW